MLDSFGPRQIAPSGPAASLPAMQAGEKVVHRPEKKVLPAEKVDRTAPSGPRPAFQHTYLEQVAAFWPEEPDPPVTQIDYAVSDEEPAASAAPRGEDTFALALLEETPPAPTVDIRT